MRHDSAVLNIGVIVNDFGAVIYGLFGRAIYLDTNVWSELAKGSLPIASLEFLLQEGNAYLSLRPYQVMNCAADLSSGQGP
jgi:hypothetical protein